jgi:hypothetical protein
MVRRTSIAQRPVLFLNIGWADRYDGTEWIRSAHRTAPAPVLP